MGLVSVLPRQGLVTVPALFVGISHCGVKVRTVMLVPPDSQLYVCFEPALWVFMEGWVEPNVNGPCDARTRGRVERRARATQMQIVTRVRRVPTAAETQKIIAGNVI